VLHAPRGTDEPADTTGGMLGPSYAVRAISKVLNTKNITHYQVLLMHVEEEVGRQMIIHP
jgi:hypothetical protein